MISQAEFYEKLTSKRKIASVKEAKNLEKALQADVSAAVLSIGNIGMIQRYVDLFKHHRLPVFLHIERIGGLAQDREGIAFLAQIVKPDGIVTTRNSLIKLAKREGLLTIQRVFLVDSDAIRSGMNSVQETQPDAIELMPALLTDSIERCRQEVKVPIIAGGLLKNREQMLAALAAGASAVSMGSRELWKENVEHEQL
ncbi:glycerol-3-phosphate responsive antiterminator [Brevibacillus fluminis]|uniref:glycerol-3-phosphate responsive antiterminator n=1 Tax=Brevibacillus fluminis TaxID=511487 RepID=UPI003F8CDE42